MGNHASTNVVIEGLTAYQNTVTVQFAFTQLAVFTPLLGLHFYLLSGRGAGVGSATGRAAEAVVAQGHGHVP